MFSRRTFLAGSTALAAAAPFSRLTGAAAQTLQRNALPIPPLLDAARMGDALSLTAQEGRTKFRGEEFSATMGFNGPHLGPTLLLRRGDETEISVSNEMREATAVHWHGLLVAAESDGGPHRMVAPGATWRPRLHVNQPAATAWYHAHPHGATARQVHAGLAGMLIITDGAEAALGLPSRYGVDDLPLILQDRSFDRRGRSVYGADPMIAMAGFRGEAVAVNGAVNAAHQVPAGLVRLRLVNASNARVYDLSFSDDRSFHWIATDGGLLDAPVPRRSLWLAPGQRAEIIVDLSDGRPVTLGTDPDPSLAMGGMHGMGMGMMGMADPAPRGMAILRLEPEGAPSAPKTIPQKLADIPRADPSTAVRRRRFVLNMGHGMHGMMGGMMGRGSSGGMRHDMFGINGRPFDMERIDARVRVGDTEIWEVAADMMAHPFHVHGVHFQVLNGAAHDRGVRDTVLVGPPVELLVTFTQPAVEVPFVFHCHTLEHEDGGMMGQFLVT